MTSFIAACADRAHAGLLAAAQEGGHDLTEQEERLIDMLTDLRHYCAKFGIDYEAADRMAETHFAEETDA